MHFDPQLGRAIFTALCETVSAALSDDGCVNTAAASWRAASAERSSELGVPTKPGAWQGLAQTRPLLSLLCANDVALQRAQRRDEQQAVQVIDLVLKTRVSDKLLAFELDGLARPFCARHGHFVGACQRTPENPGLLRRPSSPVWLLLRWDLGLMITLFLLSSPRA